MNDFPSILGVSAPRINQEVLNSISENKRNENLANYIATEATSSKMAKIIHEEIIEYQNSLDNGYDVALNIVQFGQTYTILVDKVVSKGVNILGFYGHNTSGAPLYLLQHISQLNFMMVSVSTKNEESNESKRKIGFFVE